MYFRRKKNVRKTTTNSLQVYTVSALKNKMRNKSLTSYFIVFAFLNPHQNITCTVCSFLCLSHQGTIFTGGHARLVGDPVATGAHEAELERIIREAGSTAMLAAALAAGVVEVDNRDVRQVELGPGVAIAPLEHTACRWCGSVGDNHRRRGIIKAAKKMKVWHASHGHSDP